MTEASERNVRLFISDLIRVKRNLDEFLVTKKSMIKCTYKCKTNEEVEQRFNSMFIVTVHED